MGIPTNVTCTLITDVVDLWLGRFPVEKSHPNNLTRSLSNQLQTRTTHTVELAQHSRPNELSSVQTEERHSEMC